MSDRDAGNDVKWWKLTRRPGSNSALGAEPRIASYLTHEVGVGQKFTLSQLRAALETDDGSSNADEHFNRRLRNLRSKGWQIVSHQDDGSLSPGEYIVLTVGWYPESGETPARSTQLSNKTRSSVMERDHFRCVLCGRSSEEQYEDGTRVTLTIGHIVPQARGGSHDPSNLRTECSRCNEPKRDAGAGRESYDDVRSDIRNLSKNEKSRLLTWLRAGAKGRDETEVVYDRIRLMGNEDRESAIEALIRATGVPK